METATQMVASQAPISATSVAVEDDDPHRPFAQNDVPEIMELIIAGLEREGLNIKFHSAMNSDIQDSRDGRMHQDHFTELGTDTQAINLNYIIMGRATSRSKALKAALNRLKAGTYGECSQCEGPIPMGRLRARPESVRCCGCVKQQNAA